MKTEGGQRRFDRWGIYKGEDLMGIEGSFDPSPRSNKVSVARYSGKGVFTVDSYFDAGKGVNELGLRRGVYGRFKDLLKPDRALCLVSQAKRRGMDRNFVNIEYYAKCDKPSPELVGELSMIMRNEINDNEL